MSSDNINGLIRALSSSLFIGDSFIVKKKGLKKVGASDIRAVKMECGLEHDAIASPEELRALKRDIASSKLSNKGGRSEEQGTRGTEDTTLAYKAGHSQSIVVKLTSLHFHQCQHNITIVANLQIQGCTCMTAQR
ncbi:hypothetical protein ACFX13_038074 [Malus domestica]